MKLKSFYLVSVSLTLFFLVSCSGSKNELASVKEIFIGEVSSLSGTTASFGKSTHQGILLALSELMVKGDHLGKKIKLLTEDSRSEEDSAITAVKKLTEQDKVVAILGEVASSRSLAIAPICQNNRVPMISPSSTNLQLTRIGDYIFRACFTDPFQGEILAKFIYNSLNIKRIAILKDAKNEYSLGLTEFFKSSFKRLGGQILGEESFFEGDVDFTSQLISLKNLNPEAIFLPSYYREAALIIRQARNLNMSTPFVGSDGWDSVELTKLAGPAIDGSYYCNQFSADDPSARVRAFVKQYQARFHELPDASAALGFDAANLLFTAIKKAGSIDREKIRAALASTKSFKGVTGTISFASDRNPRKAAVIEQIINGKSTYKETLTR